MLKTNFGIEIEMTGITRCKAAKTIAKLVDGKIEHLSDTYDTYKVITPDNRCWKIVRDASIRCERKNGLNAVPSTYSVELVSPILKYDADINLLQEIVRALRKAGAFSNSSTGIHYPK